MKQLFTIVVLGLLATVGLQAQILRGKIVDEKSQPMSYATIYVQELFTGVVSNEKGEFSIHLEKGDYNLRFQYLGYETQIKQVKITGDENLNVQMKPVALQLRQVDINAKDEDPAYRIIRRAIAYGPYYRNLLSYVKLNAYIKGTYSVKKVPGWMKKVVSLTEKDQKSKNDFLPKEGDVYMKESVSEITRDSKKTKYRVLSVNSSMPEMFDTATYSLYNMFLSYGIYGKYSPLGPYGLSYYKYRLESSNINNGVKIYHIRVTPRTANPNLVMGTIDIVDSLWCVYHFNLSGEIKTGFVDMNFRFQQMYSEIEKYVWLPASTAIQFDAKIMGVDMSSSNMSSIKYINYTLNRSQKNIMTSLPVSDSALVDKRISLNVSEKSKKIQEEIDKLSQKEKLNNRDAVKMVNLFEKKLKEDAKTNKELFGKDTIKKDDLEVKGIEEYISMSIDSNARNKDSVYWEQQRVAPLSLEEKKGFEKRAALLELEKNDTTTQKQKNKSFAIVFPLLYFQIDSLTTFDVNLLSGLNFNLVDGWAYGMGFSLKKKLKNDKRWESHLTAAYTFDSKHFPLTFSSTYHYNPMKQASLSLQAGRKSFDFNKETGVGNALNAFSSLFFRENYINFYDRTFINLNHGIEVFNGFIVNLGFAYERQKQLYNITDYSFFFRDSWNYRSNEPDNSYTLSNPVYLQDASSSILDIKFEYTPRMYYRYQGRKKENLSSKYPTFSLSWKKGITDLFNANNQFDQLESEIKHQFKLGLFETFNYNVIAGWFPNNNEMHFSNFKHFGIYEFPVMTTSLSPAYHTMKTYSASTNEWYLSAFAQYRTPYLLLKYIPIFDKTIMTEDLYASYLKTPVTKDYIEIGYALTNIYLFGNIGVFVGFEDFKYANWGIKFSISLPNEFK